MEKPAYQLKPLERKHLKEMVLLDSLCFSEEDAYSLKVMSYYFSLVSSFGIGFFLGKSLIAFILCLRNHIITLDVHPEHRRKGLGENLLKYAISLIKLKGYNKVYLEVDKENYPALKLYKKLKFKIQEEFYENGKMRYTMVLNF